MQQFAAINDLIQEERSELKIEIDINHDDKNFVAVIVDFGGADGVIIIDKVWFTAGLGGTETGK